jgi:cleavage stimulation factor subunit 2
MDRASGLPKGYGFVEYADRDVATSALRNLNRHELLKRELKVDFASDNKNGSNLRSEDITNRDEGAEVLQAQVTTGIDETKPHSNNLLTLPLKTQIELIYALKELQEHLLKQPSRD